MTDALVKPEEIPPITDDEAASAMRVLKIDGDTLAIQAYKRLGTWLVQNDVGACQLAKTFDSDQQINYAIEIKIGRAHV